VSSVLYEFKSVKMEGEFTFAVVQVDADPENGGGHVVIDLHLPVRREGELAAIRDKAIAAVRAMIREDQLLAALDGH
jgi:hypothetical protein